MIDNIIREIEQSLSEITPGKWIHTDHGKIFAKNPYKKGDVNVVDVDNPIYDQKIGQIRGWGCLTGQGHGGLKLSEEEAEKIQNANAHLIVNASRWLKLLCNEIKMQRLVIHTLDEQLHIKKEICDEN